MRPFTAISDHVDLDEEMGRASAVLSAEDRDVLYALEDAGILVYEAEGEGRGGRFAFRLGGKGYFAISIPKFRG